MFHSVNTLYLLPLNMTIIALPINVKSSREQHSERQSGIHTRKRCASDGVAKKRAPILDPCFRPNNSIIKNPLPLP